MAIFDRLRRSLSSRPPAAFLPRRATYWTDFIRAHLEGSDPHSDYYDKFRQRTLIEEAGYPTPGLLATVERATAELLQSLPDAFVLKVPHKSTTRGVIPVWRDGGGFVNGFTGNSLTVDQLCDEINSHLHDEDPQIIVEEFFEGEDGPQTIPQDYRIYTFETGVEFVDRVDRNNGLRSCVLMSTDGDELSPQRAVLGSFFRPIPASLPPNVPEMFEAAITLRDYCDRPMIRVDIYSDGSHYAVGELTTTPGPVYYRNGIVLTETEDLRLGNAMQLFYQHRSWAIPTITENPPSVARRHESGFRSTRVR